MNFLSTPFKGMGKLCLNLTCTLFISLFLCSMADAQILILTDEAIGKRYVEMSDPIDDPVIIYPNPATTEVHLQPEVGISIVNLEIYDALGNKVFESALPGGQAYANLTPGTYVFKIFFDNLPPETESVVILP